MATYTSNYNFKLPSSNDYYRIADFNDNMIAVDTELKQVSDKAYCEDNPPPYPVTKVNGKTGEVDTTINYIEGEVDTGNKWIDGKSIYRYVCTGTTSSSPFIVGTLPEAADTVISLTGVFKRSGDASWFTLPNTHPSALTWSANLSVTDSTNVQITFGGSITGARTVIVIVEYTKSTD